MFDESGGGFLRGRERTPQGGTSQQVVGESVAKQ